MTQHLQYYTLLTIITILAILTLLTILTIFTILTVITVSTLLTKQTVLTCNNYTKPWVIGTKTLNNFDLLYINTCPFVCSFARLTCIGIVLVRNGTLTSLQLLRYFSNFFVIRSCHNKYK